MPPAAEDEMGSIGLMFVELSSTGRMREAIQLVTDIGELIMLLIPDSNVVQEGNVIWCLPVPTEKWNKWAGLARKFKALAWGDVYYMTRFEGRNVRTVLVLMDTHHTKEEVETAIVALRMGKFLTDKIYVMPHAYEGASSAQVITSIAMAGNGYEHCDDEPKVADTQGVAK